MRCRRLERQRATAEEEQQARLICGSFRRCEIATESLVQRGTAGVVPLVRVAAPIAAGWWSGERGTVSLVVRGSVPPRSVEAGVSSGVSWRSKIAPFG